MKRVWQEVLLAAGLGFGAPWLILGLAAANVPERSVEQTTAPATAVASDERYIQVQTEDGTVEMSLDEYLIGVLLCEMPEEFAQEAKKAQAVVARTYALRTAAVKDKHPMDAVCTSPDCCQGYISREMYTGSQDGIDSADQAVKETAGLVLMYEGELIDATYFSCSGGMTEDAVAVWGAEIPYLQSVSSPGEEQAVYYTDSVTFTAEEFQEALSVNLSGNPAQWLGAVTYTEGGGVDTMVIGGTTYKGTALRTALGLRSTAFVMVAAGEEIIITTRGFGHRVGMSQYGAEAMAVAGKSFEEILAHYYLGTELTTIEP